MRSKTILIIALYLIFCSRSYGQSSQFIFSHIDFTNGLSGNHVTCFYKDAKGFMWFGTPAGLDRYDGYQFKVFKHDPADPHSIADDYIEQIFDGPDGKLWVESREGRFNTYDLSTGKFDHGYAGYLKQHSLPDYWLSSIIKGKSGYWFIYENDGICHYLSDGHVITLKHIRNDPYSLDSTKIVSAKEDANGDIWVIHQNGLLEKVAGSGNTVVFRTNLIQQRVGKHPVTYRMFIDSQNGLWFCSFGVFKGALYYDPLTNTLRQFSQDSGSTRLNSNIIYSIIQDNTGLIWLAADHGGVNIIDKRDFSVKYVEHIEDDNKSIAENSIAVMYKDSLGIIWLGTFRNGISYYNPGNIRFPQYRHQPFNPSSLSYNDINSFAEDAAGNIWIGANGGGLIYFNRKTNTFRQYLHDPLDNNSLGNDIIVSLLLDKQNRLWIGTYFGGLDCYDGQRFIHYRHSDKNPGSLADDRVMCLCEDTESNLWVGTLEGGMDRFEPQQKIFVHYKYQDSAPGANSIRNNYVSSIVEDSKKNLWIGTAYGIDVLEKSTGRFVHYSRIDNKLSSENTVVLFNDSRHLVWVGTREGLDLFNPVTKTFQSFRMEDGLPDNSIRSITEDDGHNLWIGTSNGIAKISVQSKSNGGYGIICASYLEQDGLQGRDFNERAGLKTRDGYIIFGGVNGFNIFNPSRISATQTISPIVFTDLEIFNKSVNAGDETDGHTISAKAITETNAITLNYSDNIFSIEFASLSFVPNAKVKYAYTLEGFNTKWLTTDAASRKATYTNLNPGKYHFRVRATNEDGEWTHQEAVLQITILPPLWETPIAYALYLLVFFAMLYFARRMIIQRARMRFVVEHEREESRRIHEVDMMKIRFFTNMSHELRTPLSLILAPVERLLDNPRLPNPKMQYEVIRRNAKRLLFLVNQLLDFRKMETNELKLHPEQGDLLTFVKDISYSFIDLAEKKEITFAYTSELSHLLVPFDHDKIERILFNLLSNAFKFTPENGDIHVDVRVERKTKDDILLIIEITDTGIGIAKDQQEKIFEPFFQTHLPNGFLNQGTGLGLAITLEFVKMHSGTLTVNSEPGEGSCFTVSLPFKAPIMPEPDTQPDIAPASGIQSALVKVSGVQQAPELTDRRQTVKGDNQKHTILIVEDNDDFRFYLKDNLLVFFNIIEASDGKEGWQKSLASHPDLVVSDVSMPVMNGIDLCRKIKSDERTRHMPVILLTALASEAHELLSLKTGATDYITKPFNFEVLLSKIRNQLQYNDTIKKTYQRQVQASPANIEIKSSDDLFVRQVLDLIEKNMNNPDFSVQELSAEFHSSRSTFYKKLLLLTGKTPVELIRHIRLKRAAELLEKSQMNVSEIAYTVGFNDPKYFAQYFKAEFDMVPSAYRAKIKQRNAEGGDLRTH